ncbi:acetyl-CoA hydrolase/transferase family protein [Oscillatoria amoena NRMC-F 0135]|nr:acetyl-CoA hydrolase/transferase family protein [Oscillatoria amoena NRMC-F 0135]
MAYTELTAQEAAEMIQHGESVGFSGFTPAGSPKAVPLALAEKAKREHAAGRPFKIGVLTGASTGKSLDGALAEANAISFRTPYQSDSILRKKINAGEVNFFDMHLSQIAQNVRYGFLGKVKWAVLEACDIGEDGSIVLSTSVGTAPTYAQVAEKIIVELNAYHPKALNGIHDIYQPLDPPNRREIPLYHVSDRIGSPVIKVDPSKIAGIVRTNLPDETSSFPEPNEVTLKIGQNVASFLAGEMKAGRIPPSFLPIQSGVGDIANAVLFAMGSNPDIPAFEMYTEVIQDSVIKLMGEGRIKFASGCSLTVSNQELKRIYGDMDFFKPKLVLRPQEISNNPEIVRRIGIVSINTAIEVDLFGNVNSTHVLGAQMMNGIGGSGDFTRNSYISIFTCPSIVKDGKISTIVPMVSHIDHNEHSVQIVITDQGIADLRGKSPHERAEEILNKCVHPEYRPILADYLNFSKLTHTNHTLGIAFRMHEQFTCSGDMRGVKWN